jgi:hypothetical protein
MGNMTIDAYQVPRDAYRDKSGSKYYPGGADMYTMRIDEHEICLAFRDVPGYFPVGADVDVYRGHLGTAVFSNLVGMKSKFWILNNCRVVGVAKSHTTLDDRSTKEYSQLAVFIGGTTSVVNNGQYAIPAGHPVRVNFYDAIHDPDEYEALFMNSKYLDREFARPLPVIEPHDGAESIVDTMNRNFDVLVGRTREEDAESTSGLSREDWKNRNTFSGILQRMHGSVADLMAFGALAFQMFAESGGDGDFDVDAFREWVRGNDAALGDVGAFRSALRDRPEGSAELSAFGTTIASMMYSTARGRSARGSKEAFDGETAANRERLTFANELQSGVRECLYHQTDLIEWDRRWIIGEATSTANPGDRLDIKLQRM